MKNSILIFLIFFYFVLNVLADNKNTGDQRPLVQKIENGWNKIENELPSITNLQTIADGISYSANSDGIYIILPKATNNVKLLAMTGEVVWSGNLVQGRFFIPTRQGIYFLRVNNKSYKIICK